MSSRCAIPSTANSRISVRVAISFTPRAVARNASTDPVSLTVFHGPVPLKWRPLRGAILPLRDLTTVPHDRTTNSRDLSICQVAYEHYRKITAT
jgi:hypothetical protein